MIKTQTFEDLGSFRNQWLDAHYHFSFAGYYNPEKLGLGALRVWNDDTIQPGTGFDPHSHRDMEIITYVRKGAVTHKDNLGNEGRTIAGDVQVMSAGTGITHGEWNMEGEDTTLFQIWIEPNQLGVKPRWETRTFPKENQGGALDILASGRPQDQNTGALSIHQDAAVLGGTLRAGDALSYDLAPGRKAYVVPAVGDLLINGEWAPNRSGTMVMDEDSIAIEAVSDAEVVLVDVL